MYAAAVVADQNMKLSVFTTRPAIYSPLLNFTCELMSTTVLVCGGRLLSRRLAALGAAGGGGALDPLYSGLLLLVLLLGLGGPTGLSANPARDLGPRLAHWLLPIPSKGPSELRSYGWVPPLAALCGGALGGALSMAIARLDQL
ncbi:aquaporin-like protein [Haematococcus lacustris]